MAGKRTTKAKTIKKSPAKPLRVGKLRDSDSGRGWRAKLYGSTNTYAYHRLKFKDPKTKAWVDRPVPVGEDPEAHFDAVERALDARVSSPSASSGNRPTMAMLVARYLDWLRAGGLTRTYVGKVENLLNVWVLRTHRDLEVQCWGPEHSRRWIAAARKAGLSPSRVEDLGVALSGARKTAWRKSEDDATRWLDPSDNPLEDVSYSRRGTEEGAHRDYVPPSARPTTAHVSSLVAAAAKDDAPWSWMPTQLKVGAFCGPRLGEQMAQRAVDPDFINRNLRIRNSISWPHPKSEIDWEITPTKTKRRREVPYAASMHEELLALCRHELGLPDDATVEEVTAAQDELYETHLRELDEKFAKSGAPRPVSPHEHLLFIDPGTGRPPTKERYGDVWRDLRADSEWPNSIPWLNARHHAATWWPAVMVDPQTGRCAPDALFAGWLGHSLATYRNHYVRAGDDDRAVARKFLDEL